METVVVTGAGRGVGLALAQRFVNSGRRVIATYRTADGRQAIERLGGGARLVASSLDVADEASVQAFCQTFASERLDVLVNNAGVYGPRNGLDHVDGADWRHTFEVNTLAPFRLSTLLLPALKQAERPRIVTLSSQMGSLNRRSGGAYAYRGSKAALNKIMQALAVDLRSAGVIVCVVHPGWVRTDMGGPQAELTPAESANGIVELTDRLTLADSGRFFTWTGDEHPW